MSTPRKAWRGSIQPAAEGASGPDDAPRTTPLVEQHKAFGWVVHRHVLPVGAALVVVSSGSVPRENAPNLALYVRGRGAVSNPNAPAAPDRTPGLFTGDRPAHPIGITRITAVEELEFWCFNWHANRGALPAATPLRATNMETVELPQGQRVLLCVGALGGHGVGPFVADGSPMVAIGDVFGFLIGGDRG